MNCCGPSWIGQAITWVLICLGWMVVNIQHNRRETRKEVRAALLELYKHLDGIEEAAFTYHTEDGDVAVGRRIKRDLLQIAPRIVMARRGGAAYAYAKPLGAFRRAITIENFDTAQFAAKSPNAPIFDDITAAKRDLIVALESGYLHTFK